MYPPLDDLRLDELEENELLSEHIDRWELEDFRDLLPDVESIV
jgi:hypothetical protein